MQTVVNLYPISGLPGQFADNAYHEVKSYAAKVAIGFGILCEIVLTSGFEEIQPVKDSGTTSTFLPVLAGVTAYDPAREQALGGGGGSYAAGEMVPCVRKGRVFGVFDGGGTWPTDAAVRVWHSSDGTHLQGVFTMSAASATGGAEIDLVPATQGIVIGTEPDRASGSYPDAAGNVIQTAVVALNLV